jgi:hypothetical protein
LELNPRELTVKRYDAGRQRVSVNVVLGRKIGKEAIRL